MYATNLVFNAASDPSKMYQEPGSDDSETSTNVWISDAVDYWATRGDENGLLEEVAHLHLLQVKVHLWQGNKQNFCLGKTDPPWLREYTENRRRRTVGEYLSAILIEARKGYWCHQ